MEKTQMIRKKLINALILAFGLSIYSLWIQPSWNSYIESIGQSVGIMQSALGYLMAIVIVYVIQSVITRRLDV